MGVAAAGVPHTGVLRPVRRIGAMAALALRCAAVLVRPPYSWRGELVRQSWLVIRRSTPALLLSLAAWGFSGPGLQAGNFLTTFGSVDRAGGFMVVAILREFGTFVTATVVAGVVGTMFTAELASRRVRGEIDALETLAVDPIRDLVAPRILAFALVMMGLDLVALVAGVGGGYVATTGVLGGTTGAFLSSFFANASVADLVASVLKVGLFGLLIGIICAYHGLAATGGAEGVGRAVHRAVVGCLIAIFTVNLLYTQWFLALYPDASVFR